MYPQIRPIIQPSPKLSDGKVWYYNEGLEYPVTGGWVEGYSVGEGSQSKELSHLYLHAGDASSTTTRTWVSDDLVDLTHLNALCIDWENNGANTLGNLSYLIASTNKNGAHSVRNAVVFIERTFSRQVSMLDVSMLFGVYYLRTHARDNTSGAATSIVKIYKLWGEK